MDETTALEDQGVAEEVKEEVTETEPEETAEEETTEAEESGDEDSDEDEDEEKEPEYDEFDFGGEKFQVEKGTLPDELKERLDKFTKGTWGDYTKKSQAIAEQAKDLEARESAVQKLQSLQGEAMEAYSKGLQVRQELTELNQVNLDELWQSDPDRARRISDLKAAKQTEFNTIVGQVDAQERQLTQAQQQEMQRREAQGRQQVEKSIKGFGAKAPEVIEYAVKNYGISKNEAEQWGLNPVATVAMYKAMMYDRMQSKMNKGAKPKPTEATPIKPVKGKGGGKNIGSKPPSDPKAYAAWYQKKYGN